MEAGAVVECRRGKREGNVAVVLDVWKRRKDVYWEAFCCAGYVHCVTVLLFFYPFLPQSLLFKLGRKIAANTSSASYRNEITNSGHLYEFLHAYC